jgi:hypothetical protein
MVLVPQKISENMVDMTLDEKRKYTKMAKSGASKILLSWG